MTSSPVTTEEEKRRRELEIAMPTLFERMLRDERREDDRAPCRSRTAWSWRHRYRRAKQVITTMRENGNGA